MTIADWLGINPIIAGVASAEAVAAAVASPVQVVYVLFGDLVSVKDTVAELTAANKSVFVDVDLIEGLANRPIAIDYIQQTTNAAGILSAKGHLLAVAKERGLSTVHRFFLIDSRTLYTMEKQYAVSRADAVDIMPGIMPQAVGWIAARTTVPIISSGLISDKPAIIADLKAGASGISTTNQELWQD